MKGMAVTQSLCQSNKRFPFRGMKNPTVIPLLCQSNKRFHIWEGEK